MRFAITKRGLCREGLKLIVTLFLFYILSSKVDFGAAFKIISKAELFIFGLTFVLVILQILVATWRWFYITRCAGTTLSFFTVVRYSFFGQFFNQILPSTVGGDFVRIYYLVRGGVDLSMSTYTVIMDRFLGFFGLLILLVFTAPFVLELIQEQDLILAVRVLPVLLIGLMTAALLIDIPLKSFCKSDFCKTVGRFIRGTRRTIFSKTGVSLLVISVLIHVLTIFVMGLLCDSLDIEIQQKFLMVIVPVASLLVTLPVSVGGWGVREGVLVLGMGYAGVSFEEAFALSILYGITLLVSSLPGGAWWLVETLIRYDKNERDDAGKLTND